MKKTARILLCALCAAAALAERLICPGGWGA